MMRFLFAITVLLALGGLAFAEPPEDAATPAEVPDAARHGSKNAAFMAGHCSYSTSSVIRRVLERGTPVSVQAPLVAAALDGPVASPYTLADGEDRTLHVVANQVLDDAIAALDPADTPIAAEGLVLEQQGTHWFVLVKAAPTGE